MRLGVFGISTFIIALICLVYNATGLDSRPLRRWQSRMLNRLVGVRVVVRGTQSDAAPQLVVANHISYFDITVLASLVKGEFVARGDMATWPFFGFVSKAAKVVFIDRRRSAASQARDQLQERLESGTTLIMFPESTSGDGNIMKPFKSALFNVAERHVKDKNGNDRAVVVQPVSIAYTRLNGMPLGVGWRAFVAWYGDMELPSHLWQVAKLGKITCEVIFHPAVSLADFPDRKALAAHCDRVTRTGFAQLLAGRVPA